MKIYNKIVYDKYDNIIEEDSYEYTGSVAKAGCAKKIISNPIVQIAIVAAIAVYAPAFLANVSGGKIAVGSLMSRAIISVSTSLILGAVGKSLAPKIDPPKLGTTLETGIQTSVKSPTAPYRVIYGSTRVGGTIVFAETTSSTNEFLHLVIVLAAHEVDDISTIYFNDDAVALETLSNDSNGIPIYTPTDADQYSGKARIKKHFGDVSQSADANLVSDITQWTTNHKISNKAYVYVRIQFDADVYPNGVPNISAVVKGKKLFDPRATSFTASSSTVNTTSNAITINSHGLSTFDRAKYDRNSQTSIGGITSGTEYYVIKVDANNFKLATNYANALAGTAISLTSVTGSTTQKFNFTTHSTNPVLAIRDYLTDTVYGMKAGTDEINDTNFQTIANTCDESVTLVNPSGTESRFTCNGAFTLTTAPKTIIENLLTTMGGFMVYSNGQFKLISATYSNPTVSLNETYLRSGLQVNTRISKKELLKNKNQFALNIIYFLIP